VTLYETIAKTAMADLDRLLIVTKRRIKAVEPPWFDLWGNEYHPNMWQLMRWAR